MKQAIQFNLFGVAAIFSSYFSLTLIPKFMEASNAFTAKMFFALFSLLNLPAIIFLAVYAILIYDWHSKKTIAKRKLKRK